MKRPLILHSVSLLSALLGFGFFRLWPTTPPLSVTQDDYLQRVAAERPQQPPPPKPAPVAASVAPKPLLMPQVVPPPVAVLTAPVAVVAPTPQPTPPPVATPAQHETPSAAPVIVAAPNSKPKPASVSPETKPSRPIPSKAATPKQAPAQGVNAQFPRKDVEPGQKSGGVNDIYQSQSSALDAFQKKVGK